MGYKQITDRKLNRAIIYLACVLCIITLGISVFAIEQAGIIDINCPIHYFTGLNCPACGATRLVISILNHQFYQAFRWNPLIFLSIPYYITALVGSGIGYTLKGRAPEWLGKSLVIYAIIMVVFMVLRNMPLLSFLGPTFVG